LILRQSVIAAMVVSIVLLMPEVGTCVASKQVGSSAQPLSEKSAKKSRAAAGQTKARPGEDPTIAQAIREISPAQIEQTIAKLVSFGTRHTLSVNNPDAATSSQGIVAARNWIKSEFELYSAQCGGCLEVKTDTFVLQPKNRIPQATELQNVYAILHGTDPIQAKRIYLVTGHYDSRNKDALNSTNPAPGANDDGSGTAVSLECARVLSKHKFPATIIFLTVAGEEQGLDGSAHFAKMAKEQGWQLEGVLNNDIVGGNRTPGDTLQRSDMVRVFSEGIPAAANEADLRRIRSSGGENDSSSRELARYIQEVGNTYRFGRFSPQLIFRRDRYLRGGDHSAFNDQGFAAVRFTEYREDFHHQHENPRTENGIEFGDLPKFVDYDYVANVARLNLATLAALASAPAPPAKVRLSTAGLENDSKIQWESAPGATAYEILWRETSAAEFPAKNTTHTTESKVDLNESKDNVIFGVRSVDAKGHKSLIVIPEPER
jgi:Peptidase family M28